MTDFKFYSKCFNCKKKKFFIRKRKIKLPIGQVASSRELICNACYNSLKANIGKPNEL